MNEQKKNEAGMLSRRRMLSQHTSGKAGGLKDCEPLEAVENPEPPKGGGYSNIFS